ncbi:MAG: FMN-binding protein [Deltaproteobacteria bacterium]|nr:MAG: FMN-binding protein [Deltaproteobacteria bacterium]
MSLPQPAVPPASPEPSSARLVATLTVAGLLSGVAIVGAWQLTLPAITAHKAEALRQAVFEVVPGATTMQPLHWTGSALEAGEGPDGGDDRIVYGAYDDSGSLLGYAIPAEGPGFQDTISLIFGFEPDDDMIIGMRVLESRETPGLGDKIVKDADFVANFDHLATRPGLAVVSKGAKTQPYEIEAITGATISSKAVTRIISNAVATWGERLPDRQAAPALVAPAPSEEPP